MTHRISIIVERESPPVTWQNRITAVKKIVYIYKNVTLKCMCPTDQNHKVLQKR